MDFIVVNEKQEEVGSLKMCIRDRRYTDGGSKRQFQFAFSSRQEYDQDARINTGFQG